MTQQTKTISFESKLDAELDKVISLINEKRITGEISKSKVIRIAVAEWLDRQKRAIKILNEDKDANKTTEEVLQQNGYY